MSWSEGLIGFISYPPIPIWEVGSFRFSLHGVFAALGFVAGAWIATRELRKRGFDVAKYQSCLTWGLVGSLIGARYLTSPAALIDRGPAARRPQPDQRQLFHPRWIRRRDHRRGLADAEVADAGLADPRHVLFRFGPGHRGRTRRRPRHRRASGQGHQRCRGDMRSSPATTSLPSMTPSSAPRPPTESAGSITTSPPTTCSGRRSCSGFSSWSIAAGSCTTANSSGSGLPGTGSNVSLSTRSGSAVVMPWSGR